MQVDTLSLAANAAAQGFPSSIPIAVAAAAGFGGLGAFAADLLADGGKLDRWSREEKGWTLGFPAKILIGAVAAILIVAVNPPGASWPSLIATALAAGVGGEAILMGIVATGRVQSIARERDAAEERTQTVIDTASVQLDHLGEAALVAHEQRGGISAGSGSRSAAATRQGAPDSDGFEDALRAQVTAAKATLQTLGQRSHRPV